jgi:hypothetical protein
MHRGCRGDEGGGVPVTPDAIATVSLETDTGYCGAFGAVRRCGFVHVA